jgi:D-arginine dehydrogenase
VARTCDFLVVGGGIAGASAAYALSAHGKVCLVEQESQLGYHSTARSAAVHSSAYGPATWQAITTASRSFLVDTPDGFSHAPLTKPLGALFLAKPEEEQELRQQAADLDRQGVGYSLITPAEASRLSPCVRMEPFSLALYEPDCVDLDASALLHGYLRAARSQGAEVISNAELKAAKRRSGIWRIDLARELIEARVLVNAAGAWVDLIAERAGLPRRGLRPLRRTVITFDPPAGHDVSRWPMTFDVAETWYFKPEGRQIMMSPTDLTPSEPVDAQPEQFDIAVAIDRIETVTTMKVGRLNSRWAGLRTFAPDHEAVIGADPVEPSFVWYAGQGGNGVMASPAGAAICAAAATGGSLPASVARLGLTSDMIAPGRLSAV